MKKNMYFLTLLSFLKLHAFIEIGKLASDFCLPDEMGKMHSLSEWRGKKVALVFYPSGSTPYCKLEAETLRDEFIKLEDAGVVVVGINNESKEAHLEFKNRLKLPFHLLTADKKVIKLFGAAGWFGYVERKTFLIDENGILVQIIDNVELRKHHEQILSGFGLIKDA
jgi:peroxiredoxin Q/BCP